MKSLMVGDSVGWSSAAGYLEGVVKNIVLSRNAAGGFVPWLDIEVGMGAIRLCATESNLKMMRLIKIEYMYEMA